MIYRAHLIVYSKNAEANRAFFLDVLGFPSVDAGHGWLLFALPPAKGAVHSAGENSKHELYFMCDDLAAEIASLAGEGVQCSAVYEERWVCSRRSRCREAVSSDSINLGILQPYSVTVKYGRTVA
jgi:hypothetical protein